MEKTKEEIEAAYKVARRIAHRFMAQTSAKFYRPHMDIEDYVQEGILAWLEGRDMYYRIVDVYRQASPSSRWDREKKNTPEPTFVEYSDFTIPEEDKGFFQAEAEIDAAKIISRIEKIADKDIQFGVQAYLLFGLSLRQIAEVVGQSHETVRSWLMPMIEQLKEEFKC